MVHLRFGQGMLTLPVFLYIFSLTKIFNFVNLSLISLLANYERQTEGVCVMPGYNSKHLKVLRRERRGSKIVFCYLWTAPNFGKFALKNKPLQQAAIHLTLAVKFAIDDGMSPLPFCLPSD